MLFLYLNSKNFSVLSLDATLEYGILMISFAPPAGINDFLQQGQTLGTAVVLGLFCRCLYVASQHLILMHLALFVVTSQPHNKSCSSNTYVGTYLHSNYDITLRTVV